MTGCIDFNIEYGIGMVFIIEEVIKILALNLID